jgi:hypothetical protein
MTHFATFARVCWCTTFVVALAGACGGQSLKGRETGDAGAGGTAPSGGSSGHAGSQASGGSSGSGTTAGTAGTAGAVNRDACTGPSSVDSSCAAYFQRWTHDETTGLCVPVPYGGCGATKNNYETLAACQQACPNGNPNYDTCQVATDCMLGSVTCCGVCDGPSVTAHDFTAYNKRYQAQAQPCSGADVGCGACLPVEAAQNTRLYFVPNCVRGECVVEDIRESDVSACETNADCRLRRGTGCCAGCGELVAVRGDGSLEKLVCGDVVPPCVVCDDLPPAAEAQCSAEGHCIVRYLMGEQP